MAWSHPGLGVYSFSLEEGGVGHCQGRNWHWCGDPAFLPQTLPEGQQIHEQPYLFLKQKWHKHHNTVHGDQVALEYSLTAFLEAPKRGQTEDFGMGVGLAPRSQRTPVRPQIPWGMGRSEIRSQGSLSISLG